MYVLSKNKGIVFAFVVGVLIMLVIYFLTSLFAERMKKYTEFEVGLLCDEKNMYYFQIEVLDVDLSIEETKLIQDNFLIDIDCSLFMYEYDKLTFVQTWFDARYDNKFKVSWADQ